MLFLFLTFDHVFFEKLMFSGIVSIILNVNARMYAVKALNALRVNDDALSVEVKTNAFFLRRPYQVSYLKDLYRALIGAKLL